jgi:hypothetical protein
LCRAAELTVREGDSKLARSTLTAAFVNNYTTRDTEGPMHLQVGGSMACYNIKTALTERV